MADLKKDEHIILDTKPHWVGLLVPFLVALATVVVGAYFQGYTFILTLLGVAFLCYRIAEHNSHIWAITNLRVIDESGIFTRQSKECPLDKVTNVSCSQHLLGRILGFGDVEIQTASEGILNYIAIAQPRNFSDTILQMQEAYKGDQLRQQAQKLAQAMQQHSDQPLHTTTQHQNNAVAVSPKMADYLELEKLFELHQKGILSEEEYAEQKRRILNNR